jgi:hypothetical protein
MFDSDNLDMSDQNNTIRDLVALPIPSAMQAKVFSV